MQLSGDAYRPAARVKPECDGDRGHEALLLDDMNILDSLTDSFVDSLEGGSDCVLKMLLENFGSPDSGQKTATHAVGPGHHVASYHGADAAPRMPALAPPPPAACAPVAAPTHAAIIPQRAPPMHTSGHPHPSYHAVPAGANCVPPTAGMGGFIPTPSVPVTGPAPQRPLPAPVFAERAQPNGLGVHAVSHEHPDPDGALLNLDSALSPMDGAAQGPGLQGVQPGRGWYGYPGAEDPSSRLVFQPCDDGPVLSRRHALPPAHGSVLSPRANGFATAPASSPDESPTAAPPLAAPPPPPTASAVVRSQSGSGHRRRSLLLRVFNGLMRPDVAPLAAAAAKRACVTEPSVRPGLYFTVAQPAPAPAPPSAPGPSMSGSMLSGGSGSGSWGAGGKGVKPPKRIGKDKQGAGGPVAPVLIADPFKRLYPEADEELMAALYGSRPLPQRVRVERIQDRCHPCFRNTFEGLAAVADRRKVVACGSIPDGSLLGPYTGELRSGRVDERLVGGDLSGVEGLKAAFTLTLLDELEPVPLPTTSAAARSSGPSAAAPRQHSSLSSASSSSLWRGQPGQGLNGGQGASSGPGAASGAGGCPGPAGADATAVQGPDCLVVVGDPATCPLAEANAPRFWGPCSSLPPGGVGMGNAAACNCRAYKGRDANAAVVPCVLKVSLLRLRVAVDAEARGGNEADEGGDIAALREGLEVLRAAAAAVAQPGSAAGGAGGVDDANTYVYGIVGAVVTSCALQDGTEVLLRWDNDDESFVVAEQNLRQYQYIQKLTSERDAVEAKHGQQRRELAVLRKAHKDCRSARDAAIQSQQETVRQHDEAVRQLNEMMRQRDEAARQRDEALQEVRRQRGDVEAVSEAAAAAAAAEIAAARAEAEASSAAAGARVAMLEGRLSQVEAEREALRAQLAELQRSQQQQQQHGGLLGHEDGGRLGASEHGLPYVELGSAPVVQDVSSLRESPAAAQAGSAPAGAPPSKRQRLGPGQHSSDTPVGTPPAPAVADASALIAAAGEGEPSGLGPCGPCGDSAALLRRYAEARRAQDEVMSQLAALLEQRQRDGSPAGAGLGARRGQEVAALLVARQEGLLQQQQR